MELSMRKFIFSNFFLMSASIGFAFVLWLAFDFLVLSHFLENRDSEHLAYVVDDRGWYQLVPNARVATTWGRKTYTWRTGSNAFRVDEHRREQPQPAEFLFLGDSFTFGVGPWEETFVGMFEKATGKAIINAGVPSYSPTAYFH